MHFHQTTDAPAALGHFGIATHRSSYTLKAFSPLDAVVMAEAGARMAPRAARSPPPPLVLYTRRSSLVPEASSFDS
jgi:hypothetical protein